MLLLPLCYNRHTLLLPREVAYLSMCGLETHWPLFDHPALVRAAFAETGSQKDSSMNGARRLRKRLQEPGLVVAPAAHDVVAAKLVERAGFDALYVGSYAVSASLLGMPDSGFLTMTEMVTHCRNIAHAVDIPVIADAEDGYGDITTIGRTVREFEKAGVGAIHLEDLAFGKHLSGVPSRLEPIQDMCHKLQAALEARQDPNFIIIARTDALWVTGSMDQALERCMAYANVGCDLLWIVGLRAADIPEIIPQIPAPLLSITLYHRMTDLETKGLKVAIFPNSSLISAYAGMSQALNELKKHGTLRGLANLFPQDAEVENLMGISEVEASLHRHGYHVPEAPSLADFRPQRRGLSDDQG